MGHGIGPQSLGASGQNPKSKPCGTPLDFNEKLEAAERAGKLPESFAKEVRANSAANYGTPLNSQMPGMGVGMGSMVKGIGSLFNRASIRKREMAGNRGGGVADMIPANPGPASPGGGSAGMQADLEGLQSKLADLKSQIDNLANTV